MDRNPARWRACPSLGCEHDTGTGQGLGCHNGGRAKRCYRRRQGEEGALFKLSGVPSTEQGLGLVLAQLCCSLDAERARNSYTVTC